LNQGKDGAMVRLKVWQWVVLALPIASIIGFLMIAAGMQIHEWGLSWIWGVFTLVLVGWRWLLVKWTQPAIAQVEAVIAQVNKELESTPDNMVLPGGTDAATKAIARCGKIGKRFGSDVRNWW
jgi:uncharacterized protein